MAKNEISLPDLEAQAIILSKTINNPLLFVKSVFPWGKGQLTNKKPYEWQENILKDIESGILSKNSTVQIAVSSGHGVGKSALVAWLILWALTMPDTKGFVTANTETQLTTKTWAELAKWHSLYACASLFTLSKTSIFASNATLDKTWRIDAIAWNENRPEAFAGLHNEGKRIIMIFDEGSGIPDIIYQTAEGALTDKNTQKIFIAFGNPTRPTGRFREFFGKSRHNITTYIIDSRSVEGTDKEQIEKWRVNYGEDSDFFRVRVRGLFPNTTSDCLIGTAILDKASERILEKESYEDMAIIMGVDVARFGSDRSAIAIRQGGKLLQIYAYSGLNTMQLAGKIVDLADKFCPNAIFIDATGIGAGVVDRLKEISLFGVRGIDFASVPERKDKYYNKRAEMWAEMAAWLEFADIIEDKELYDDLAGPTYSFSSLGQIKLEKKEDMKKRGLSSPDKADALALTFAEKVKNNIKPKIFGRLR